MDVLKQRRIVQHLETGIFGMILLEAFFLAWLPALAKAAVILGTIFYVAKMKISRDWTFHRMPFDAAILIFVLCGAISIGYSPDPFFSFYNFYHLVGLYVLTYLLLVQNVHTERQVAWIVAALGCSLILVVLYGYYQYFFGIDASAVEWVDGNAFPELKKRIFSTWENPNIFAAYLDLAICMVFGFFVTCKGRLRMGLGVGLLLLLAALGMTYARGACLSVAIILAGYGLVRDRRIFLGCLFLGAVVLLLDAPLAQRLTSVFTKIDTSSEMRLAFWQSSLAMIKDHPFFGIGWGAYWMVYPQYDFYMQGAAIKIVHAHNLYLNYAVEIGLLGAAAFCYYFFGTMGMALRRKNAPQSEFLQGLLLGLGLAILSVALNGLTDDVLFNTPSSMLLWYLCALVVLIRKRLPG